MWYKGSLNNNNNNNKRLFCLDIAEKVECWQHININFLSHFEAQLLAFLYSPGSSKTLIRVGCVIMEKGQGSVLICKLLDGKEEVIVDREGNIFNPIFFYMQYLSV